MSLRLIDIAPYELTGSTPSTRRSSHREISGVLVVPLIAVPRVEVIESALNLLYWRLLLSFARYLGDFRSAFSLSPTLVQELANRYVCVDIQWKLNALVCIL